MQSVIRSIENLHFLILEAALLSKKTVITILSWCAALAIALILANVVSFFYRSGAGSIQRENAYSTSIRTPNSRIVRGAEGYGVNAVDENGSLNDN